MAFADADLKNPTLAGDMPTFNSTEQSDDVRSMARNEPTQTPPANHMSQSLATTL